MLAPSPVVKKVAREILSNCFLQSIVVCCILLFSFFAATLISSLISIFAGMVGYYITLVVLFLIALGPLLLGVFEFFRRRLWQQEDSILVVFKYFSGISEYKRAMRFIFSISARFAIIALVLYLPCIIVTILSNEQIYSLLGVSLPLWTSNLWALNSFLAFISSLVFVFVTLKYYLSAFIFISNDSMDIGEAINMSTIISKRTGADFFGLAFSFIGWILVSLLVLPLVFTLPYFIQSYCVHCRFAITAYNLDVDTFNANDTPSFRVDEI